MQIKFPFTLCRLFSCLAIVLIFHSNLSAQLDAEVRDSMRYRYEHRSILLQNNSIAVGGEKHFFNLFFAKNGVPFFKQSHSGWAEFKKARQNQWVSFGFSLASGIAVSGLLLNTFTVAKKVEPVTVLGWTGLTLATTIGASAFQNKAQNQLQRAVWYYNRDALLRD
jgi:hypothetical protein